MMRSLFLVMLATLSIATASCSTSETPEQIETPVVSLPAGELALFAAYVARDRSCAATAPTYETYERCMARADLDVCTVSQVDWSDLHAALRAYGVNAAESLEESRAQVAAQCGSAAPEGAHTRWRVSDRCETSGPFLRAAVTSRWIRDQDWSSDRKAMAGGWCEGNTGRTYYRRHCGDYVLSQRRVGHRPPAQIYGFEESICRVL